MHWVRLHSAKGNTNVHCPSCFYPQYLQNANCLDKWLTIILIFKEFCRKLLFIDTMAQKRYELIFKNVYDGLKA